MSLEIVCFEKMNGERIIAEVSERGKHYHTLNNPMAVYPSQDGTKIGFAPCLYSDPKKMTCKLYIQSIITESLVADTIANAYVEYVKMLTSSIIQLDKTVKPVQLING